MNRLAMASVCSRARRPAVAVETKYVLEPEGTAPEKDLREGLAIAGRHYRPVAVFFEVKTLIDRGWKAAA